MARAALAHKVVAPIFPENVTKGDLLKLTSREDTRSYIIVEVLRETDPSSPNVFWVLAFDTGSDECILYGPSQALEYDINTPALFFLRADIATAEEVATYIDKRRGEIGKSLAKLEALRSRFEEKVGYRLPIPE